LSVAWTAPLRSAATESHGGSTISGAVFNFTNCIIGAGAIGLGGAFALSGGIISVVSIIFFGVLTKLSLDLVVSMPIQSNGSYETLGKVAFGQAGWIAVLMSKFLYSFGCLIAYIVVIKDNMNVAVLHLLYGNHPSDTSWFVHLLK
jgi:sodium-coupled neutral amino acid transporter 11